MAEPILLSGYDRSAYYANRYPQPLFDPEKVVLHSTEGASLPDYYGGGTAPNVTIDPWRRKCYQHFPLNIPSRALKNPASTAVSENFDGSVQIEIIGCSDSRWAVKIGRPDRDLDRLTDDDYDWLAAQVSRICDATGIPARLTTREWVRYPDSYGLYNGVRMTGPEYDAFRGICGHMHVSGNDHGDPKLDRDKLQAAIDRLTCDPEVMAAQRLYNEALAGRPGFQPLDVDGIDGPLTQAAKEAYMTTLDQLADLIKDQGKTIDTLAEKVRDMPAAAARAVWRQNLKGQDASFWARLAAGGIKTDADGNPVAVTPVIPPISGPVA